MASRVSMTPGRHIATPAKPSSRRSRSSPADRNARHGTHDRQATLRERRERVCEEGDPNMGIQLALRDTHRCGLGDRLLQARLK